MKKIMRELINKLESMKGKTTFIYLHYINANFEESKYILLLNAKLKNRYNKDLAKLKQFKPQSISQTIAKEELIESLKDSINGYNPRYKLHGYYEENSFNTKLNESGELYLQAFCIAKKVIVKGNYPTHNSKQVSIDKAKLRHKYIVKSHTYKVNESNIIECRIDGRRYPIQQYYNR